MIASVAKPSVLNSALSLLLIDSPTRVILLFLATSFSVLHISKQFNKGGGKDLCLNQTNPQAKSNNQKTTRHMKVERIYHLPILSARSVKGNPSGRKKTIPGGNLDLHKGIKNFFSY